MDRLRLGAAVLGGVLMIGGIVVGIRQGKDSGQAVVITEGTLRQDSGQAEIVVDVAGAVERPGVYRLSDGSRVNDALVAAGGLGEKADRGWVARYLNLAQAVPDGAKIYIPVTGEAANNPITNKQSLFFADAQNNPININTASASELESLWGIGEKRAQDIVTNRPYQNIEELMSRAGVPKNVLERIRDQISL